MNLVIHHNVITKLNLFIQNKKTPNIIFHGPHGSGKRTIVAKFISDIYNNDKELIKSYVMNVNCAHGKGIKFIREDLKFFAKTHINTNGLFKTIILSNADKLTTDAQSALRRCIELFSHTTRFFIIVDNKYKLLKPIISRFCDIFIPVPVIKNERTNLHKYSLEQSFGVNLNEKKRDLWIKKYIENTDLTKYEAIIDFSLKLYEKGYNSIDLMKYIENSDIIDVRKFQMLNIFNKVKREFRNEQLFMMFMLNFIFIRSDVDLENISFM